MSNSDFYGWKLLAALWLILLISSAFPLYGGSVMNAYMATDLGIARDQAGLPILLYQLVFGLGAPVVSVLINRIGVRLTLTGGALVMCLGALAMAFLVYGTLTATLVFGLLIGSGGAAAGGIATQTSVARWFLRRRALAFAILMSAPGIGGFFVAPLINRVVLAAEGNWRAGWWLVAVVAGATALLALLSIKEFPADLGQEPDGQPVESVTGKDHGTATAGKLAAFITVEEWTAREVFRCTTYWLMLIAVLAVNAGTTLFFAVGILHLQELGHSATVGSWALGLFGISALIAKVALGALGDRFDPRYLWAATIAGFGLGLFFIADAREELALQLFPILMGFGFGGSLACMFAVLSNYFGPKVFPTITGVAVACTIAAGSLSPYFAGFSYRTTGSYQASYLGLAIACGVGTAIMLMVRKPIRKSKL